MNRRVPSSHAVGDFTLREDPLDETFTVAFDGRGNARDVGRVDTQPNDCRHMSMILPTPGDDFEWRETACGPALVCRPLAQVARHLFTTRPWPLGNAASSPTAWCDPAEALGVPPGSLIRLKQVHGRAMAVAEQLTRDVGSPLPDADIVLSNDPTVAIAVQAADCVPLLIADRRLGVVAAAHAGWRGLVQRVPVQVIDDLAKTYGSKPRDLIVAVGPSVGACCYEVGPDVTSAFDEAGFDKSDQRRWFVADPAPTAANPSMPGVPTTPRPGHVYFDGWSCTRDQLRGAGLDDGQVFGAGLCSASHPELLCSYRRDGKQAGRMAGVIRAPQRP